MASNRGISEDTDGWLNTLVKLLLDAHGESWEDHDHTGKLASKDEVHFTGRPAQMGADVALVKSALTDLVTRGENPGLSSDELDTLRWHGAKSTFTSIMQHLNVPRHAVRFAGDWAAKEDAMPDVYMREAQIMVLRAQERVISYLRAGGDLFRLSGEKIGGESQESSAEARKAEDNSKVERAMAEPELFSFDGDSLAKELLDSAFDAEGKLSEETLAEEVKSVDLESKAKDLLMDLEDSQVAGTAEVDGLPVLSDAAAGDKPEVGLSVEKVQEAWTNLTQRAWPAVWFSWWHPVGSRSCTSLWRTIYRKGNPVRSCPSVVPEESTR